VFTTSTAHGTYARGAAIPITFTVTNTGTQAANFQIGSCVDYLIQVEQGAQMVWTPSVGGCGGIIRPVIIAPGSTNTYTVTWDQTDLQGNAAPAGTYTVLGKLTPYAFDGSDTTPVSISAKFASNPLSISVSP
jgi:hypothetical protein